MTTTYTPPTIDQLRAMTLRERSQAFLDWVRQQDPEGTYCPWSTGYCAGARFHQAVSRDPEETAGCGGWCDYGVTGSWLTFLPTPVAVPWMSTSASRLCRYGDLARAVQAHLDQTTS